MTSIKDVAKACSVSIATVSNIINGKSGASEDTTRRVLEAVERLNYRPNIMAKSLKQGTSATIGILTEDLRVFSTPEILDGICEYCEMHSYHFIFSNMRLFKKYGLAAYNTSRHQDLIQEEFRMLQSKQVEGIIYVATQYNGRFQLPESVPFPVVTVMGVSDDQGIPAVLFDDEKGAFEVTERLIATGADAVGFLGGTTGNFQTRRRLLGYRRALCAYGLPFRPDLVMYGGWSRENGYQCASTLYEKGVRAFFATNDVTAGGVYDVALERGVRMGTDISVSGFDGREICEAYTPPLATLKLPLPEIGRQAACVLLDMLGGTYQDQQKIHLVAGQLIERPSLATRKSENSILQNMLDK